MLAQEQEDIEVQELDIDIALKTVD